MVIFRTFEAVPQEKENQECIRIRVFLCTLEKTHRPAFITVQSMFCSLSKEGHSVENAIVRTPPPPPPKKTSLGWFVQLRFQQHRLSKPSLIIIISQSNIEKCASFHSGSLYTRIKVRVLASASQLKMNIAPCMHNWGIGWYQPELYLCCEKEIIRSSNRDQLLKRIHSFTDLA